MKKICLLFLCAGLVFSLAACGAKTQEADTADSGTAGAETVSGEKNEIGQLVDDGYYQTMSSWEDGKWIAIYQKDDSFLKVTADFPADAEEAYNALDMMADDYYEQVDAIVYSLQNVETEDISDRVPSQEELDAYVGQTFGDLEDAGYENCGWSGDEEAGDYTFMYEGAEYDLDVRPAEGTVIENMDDMSENDIRALTIGSVSFNGFAFGMLDE